MGWSCSSCCCDVFFKKRGRDNYFWTSYVITWLYNCIYHQFVWQKAWKGNSFLMKDKYPHRVIYFFTFLSILFKFVKEIIFYQKSYVAGGAIIIVCLCISVVYLDLSGYLPFTINKHYANLRNKHLDIFGFCATLYLFFQFIVD